MSLTLNPYTKIIHTIISYQYFKLVYIILPPLLPTYDQLPFLSSLYHPNPTYSSTIPPYRQARSYPDIILNSNTHKKIEMYLYLVYYTPTINNTNYYFTSSFPYQCMCIIITYIQQLLPNQNL